MPASGGEARPVTDLKYGVSAFKWSPDSKMLLVRSEVADAAQESGEEESQEQGGKDKLPEEKIYNRIRYKADGAGLWNGRRSHLHLVDLAAEETKQLTDGEFDVQSFAWSPDGTRIAYSASTASEAFPDPDFRLTNDVFVAEASGSNARQITDGSLSIGTIAFTPDGRHILLLASDLSCGFATLSKIHLVPLAGGESRMLFPDMDIQLGHAAVSDMRAGAGTPPLFSRDGQSVYLQLSQDGGVYIGRFALDGSSYELVVSGEREVYQFALTPEENIVFAAADSLQPGDLFLYSSDNGREKQLTECNKELWDELDLSKPEVFTFRTSDGWSIQGWIMKPVDFREGSKVPAVLEIHGDRRRCTRTRSCMNSSCWLLPVMRYSTPIPAAVMDTVRFTSTPSGETMAAGTTRTSWKPWIMS